MKKEEIVEEKIVVAEKDVIEELPQDEEVAEKIEIKEVKADVSAWNPKTLIGKKVKANEIKDIDELLDKGVKIQEAEIVDALVSNLEVDLLLVGQAKGKFGGGQRRVFRQTQKKTAEGNKPKFSTVAIVGNRDGYIGVGYGKGKETVPAREKAIKNAKLNIFKIRRGSGSWESATNEPHSIPFAVYGKSGSVRIKLMPAPKGKGIVAEKECKKILMLAGIKDIWTKTKGQTGTKSNLIKACVCAMQQLAKTKIPDDNIRALGIAEGRIKKVE